MPTLLSVLALIAVATLSPPSGTEATPLNASDERHPARLGDAFGHPEVATEAGRLDLAALTADWEDGP